MPATTASSAGRRWRYLVAVAPLGALVLAYPDLGIAGIWAALTVWMILRAVTNHLRTAHILRGHILRV